MISFRYMHDEVMMDLTACFCGQSCGRQIGLDIRLGALTAEVM